MSINQVRNFQWGLKSSTWLMWTPHPRPFSLASNLHLPIVSLSSRHSECIPVPRGAKFSLTSELSNMLFICLEIGPFLVYPLAIPNLTFRTSFKLLCLSLNLSLFLDLSSYVWRPEHHLLLSLSFLLNAQFI